MTPRVLPDLLLSLGESREKPELLKIRTPDGVLTISSGDFVKRALALAAGLERLGIGSGDRVGLLSENRPEWAASDFAVLLLGAVTVPLYPSLPANQCRVLLEDAGVCLAIVSTPVQLEKLVSIRESLPQMENLIVMDPDPTTREGVLDWNRLAGSGEHIPVDRQAWRQRIRTLKSDDPASIIYTSGTTGKPKGVVLTHGNFCSNILATGAAIPIHRNDTLLSFLPLSHVFQRTTDYMGFYRESTIAYAALGDTLMVDFHALKPTVVPAVPRFLEKLQAGILEQMARQPFWKRWMASWAIETGRRVSCRPPEGPPPSGVAKLQHLLAKRLVLDSLRNRAVGDRFRFFIAGGAALPLEVEKFFTACGIPVVQGYGLTETSPVIAVNSLEDNRLGTVGRPVRGVEVRVAEDGEILTRGPNVMKGYYRNDKATREVLRDGWFYTGDIGWLDPDGFLKITDRKKDLIKTSGGKSVAPQPLEGRLREDDLIAEVIVLGEGRRFISALIVPDFDRLGPVLERQGIPTGDPRTIVKDSRVRMLYQERVDRRLKGCASYEMVKRFQLLPEPFRQDLGELTPTQKVRRDRVTERYGRLIEEMYR
ncbi:MAG: long-chain fatty acid--CoA ligase [Acidobacteriota bacterium]